MLSAQPVPVPPTPPQQRGPSRDDVGRAIENAVLAPIHAMLENRLTEATAKRDAIQEAYAATSPGSARSALGAQLRTAEREVADLRSALDKIDAKVADRTVSTTPTVPTTGQPPRLPPNPRDVLPVVGSALGIIFIGFPIALAMSRLIWKRATNVGRPAALPIDAVQRFDRLEQAVDSIAIEIERISENQRYLTKVLSDPRQGVSVGAGEAGKH